MTPTPAQLRDPILLALGKLAAWQADVEVDGGDVTQAVLDGLGYVPDDPKKARNNVNFAATQTMRGVGFIAPATRRGVWALTQDGAARARVLAGEPAAPTPPVVAAPPPPAPVAAPPPPPPAVVESPWADDKAGVVLFTEHVADTYSGDNYIRSLGISETRCFGGFRGDVPTCLSCPVARSCRAHQYVKFSEAAATLRSRDTALAAARSREPSPVVQVESPDDLSAIMDDFERTDKPPPATPAAGSPESGMEVEAPVDSVCYLCGGKLPEKSLVVWNTKGFRHKPACPRP
jgi:hypothetical protein